MQRMSSAAGNEAERHDEHELRGIDHDAASEVERQSDNSVKDLEP